MKLERKYMIDTAKISWRTLDGEAVILNLDNGFYYSLNKIGTRIWELLGESKNTKEIVDIITDEYRIDSRKVKSDIANLLNELKEESIIKTCEK